MERKNTSTSLVLGLLPPVRPHESQILIAEPVLGSL